MAAIELESTLVKYAASFICAVNLVTQLFLLPAHLVPFSRCDGSARFATLVMHSRRLVTARYPSIRLLCPALSTLSRTSIPMQLRCSALPPSFFVSTEI